MAKRSYTATLVALIVLLGMWVYTTRVHRAPAAPAPETISLAAVNGDAMQSVELQTAAYHVTLRRTGSVWQMAEAAQFAPAGMVLDQPKADAIARALTSVAVRPAAATAFTPLVRVTVGAAAGGFGLELGGRSGNAYLVRRPGEAAVYLWETDLPDRLPATAAGFFRTPESIGPKS